MVGEVAIRRPICLDQVQPETLEQRPHHRAGHAVAAVDDNLQRLDDVGIDQLQRGRLELLVDVDFLQGAEFARHRRRGRLRSHGECPGCRRRRRARSRRRARAWRRCRPSGCARRCTSGRRRARASRPGNRASRFPPVPRRARRRPPSRAPRDSARQARERSGACRGRARHEALRPACPTAWQARVRSRDRSRAPSRRRSARRRGRGCRMP